MNGLDNDSLSGETSHYQSISDRVRISKHAIEGLHILQLSASSSWMVRRDLQIRLTSTVHAELMFEADIDLEDVLTSLPRQLRDNGAVDPLLSITNGHEHLDPQDPAAVAPQPRRAGPGNLVWLPVLRIPSDQPMAQRLTDVRDGQGNSVPLMPQSDVRSRLAAALTWLYLNSCFRPERAPNLSRIHELQAGLHQAIATYLQNPAAQALLIPPTDGRANGKGRTLIEEQTAIINEALEARVTGSSPSRTIGSFVQCLEYASSAYFAVVGVSRARQAPHISCMLLPAELEVARQRMVWRPPFRSAERLLGFRYEDDPEPFTPWRILRIGVEQILSLATFQPSLYYLRVPVPEVADLRRVHVTMTADEDVCLNPSVLHHDQSTLVVADDGSGPRRQMQARSRATTADIESGLSNLLGASRIGEDSAGAARLRDESLRHLLHLEVARVVERWRLRRARLLDVYRLADKTSEQPRQAPIDLVEGQVPIPIDVKSDLPAVERADTLIEQGEAVLAGQSAERTADVRSVLDSLIELKNAHHRGPHLEMTADDDPRDNVAHFHVAEPKTVFRARSDSRPVVHSIIRPSKQAREDYMDAARFTCLVSFGLLALLALVVVVAPNFLTFGYNTEALVALLLLVPGISLTLLERVPGDTFRYLVVGRAVRWSRLSLVPPTIAALLFATVFDRSLDGVESIDWMVVQWVVGVLAGLGGIIALVAGYDNRRHGRRFDYTIPVGGVVTYRTEAVAAPGSLADDDEPSDDQARPGHAAVDSRVVADLCQVAPFQADRPFRRFMLFMNVQDGEHQFLKVIQKLEDLAPTGSLPTDTGPSAESISLQIESAEVLSIASTGVAMAVVSSDDRDLPIERSEAESWIAAQVVGALGHEVALRRPNFPTKGAPALIVDEVVEESDYLVYRQPIYEDIVFSKKGATSDDLLAVVARLADIADLTGSVRRPNGDVDRNPSDELVRVSYLHIPPRRSEAETAYVKVGLAVDRDHASKISAMKLKLYDELKPKEFVLERSGRRAFPDPPERVPEGVLAGQDDLGLIVSAGRGNKGMLKSLMRWFEDNPSLALDGGTVLTAGGYACRAFQFSRSRENEDELEGARNNAEQSLKDRSLRDLEWGLARTDHRPAVATTSAISDDAQPAAWIRWRLPASDSPLQELLSGVRDWQSSIGDADGRQWPTIETLNIEFLTSKLDDQRRMSGKVRYRFRLGADVSDTQSDEMRLSLQRYLERQFAGHLSRQEHYIVVGEEEPRRPMAGDDPFVVEVD